MQENIEILGSEKKEIKSFKDKMKMIMSGVSGAFMFPIATLAILSIFLVIGGAIESSVQSGGIKTLGMFIKSFTYPLLKALPLLFCVAFAASFCKNDVTYIWAAIIAYLSFLAVQNAFITSIGSDSNITGYEVVFSGWGRDQKTMLGLVDRTLGFVALNTSIFGALVIGGVVVPFIQRHYSDIQLKGPFSFFSGKRAIPFFAALGGMGAATMFLLFWPWLGTGLSSLGRFIAKTPYGIDSFIFGFLEKSLIPFGLHHAFYSPLWYSSLGGDVASAVNSAVTVSSSSGTSAGEIILNLASGSCSNSSVTRSDAQLLKPTDASTVLYNIVAGARSPHTMWMGDSFIGMSAISMPSNEVKFCSSGSSTESLPVMSFLNDKLNVNVGRFTQGKYPVMQFGLPAAGLAMLFAAPKENRAEAKKIIIPGIASSFFMGITEPLEFAFLFLAPAVFYGFHAVMCGVSFMLMNILGAHVPSIFSGGFVEMILLGVIPMAKGTKFYMYLIVGAMLAPVYFAAFSYFIRSFNLATPGRVVSSAEESIEEVEVSDSKVPESTRKLALALGGWDNISKLSNCASRLRYDIVDKSKVNEEKLKAAGVIAVKWVGDNHVQAIVGPKAESINNEMLKWQGEPL